jgi:hypothetical protein
VGRSRHRTRAMLRKPYRTQELVPRSVGYWGRNPAVSMSSNAKSGLLHPPGWSCAETRVAVDSEVRSLSTNIAGQNREG